MILRLSPSDLESLIDLIDFFLSHSTYTDEFFDFLTNLKSRLAYYLNFS